MVHWGDEASGKAEAELGEAELVRSAGRRNSVAIAGHAAVVPAPVARALTALKRRFRGRRGTH